MIPMSVTRELTAKVRIAAEQQGARVAIGTIYDVVGAKAADGWVLESGSVGECVATLRAVRSDPVLALTPIIACVSSESIPRWLDACADGVIDLEAPAMEISSAIERIARIAERLRRWMPLGRPSKVQAWIASRKAAAIPMVCDPDAPLGFRYPPVDLIAGSSFEAELNALVRSGVLQRRFVDRFHTCPQCSDVRLAFREVCAKCRSSNVARKDLVHHYRCGHVDRESAFIDLVCPRCHEELTHIGVDYERPTSLTLCAACGEVAGEGATQARCLACGGEADAEVVPERTVWGYAVCGP